MFTVGPAFWGGEVDPYGASVVALLHLDGSNGSTTFTDQIGGNTWAATTGSPTISTTQSKFGGASLSLPGTGPCAVTSTNATGLLLPGDYSIEAWIYVGTATPYAFILSTTGGGGGGISFYADSAAVYHGRSADSTVAVSDGAGLLTGRWVHAYAGRQGTTNYVACNGVMLSTVGSSSIGTTFSSAVCGRSFTTGTGIAGYVDEVRVTKGVCRYTASFTPPTAPYPNP